MNPSVDVASSKLFGCLPDRRQVVAITLINNQGMRATVLNYGAVLQSVWVPDASREAVNVVLGFDNLDQYVDGNHYIGATIGRFANRIANGLFILDGVTYQVTQNALSNSLHGGGCGFDKQMWEWSIVEDRHSVGVQLRYISRHGEEGYPGTLHVQVTYSLLRLSNTLRLEYQARTDHPTVVNLTNHSYFNLAGEGSGTSLGHQLQINADGYLPLGADLIPTGEIEPVAGSVMDFRTPTVIGDRIRVGTAQLLTAQGYDHNYALNRSETGLTIAARVVEPITRRVMELWTTEPALDFYSGNFLDGAIAGASGHAYRQGDGFALEPEHFSNSPNNPHLPSTVLRPGQTYRSVSEYRFSSAVAENWSCGIGSPPVGKAPNLGTG